MHCVASGIVNPRYVWSRPYEIQLPWNARENGNILSITEVNTGNRGIYRCAIVSEEGIAENDIDLHVQGIPCKILNETQHIKYNYYFI